MLELLLADLFKHIKMFNFGIICLALAAPVIDKFNVLVKFMYEF